MKAVLGRVSGRVAEREVVLGIGGACARCEVKRDSASQRSMLHRRVCGPRLLGDRSRLIKRGLIYQDKLLTTCGTFLDARLYSLPHRNWVQLQLDRPGRFDHAGPGRHCNLCRDDRCFFPRYSHHTAHSCHVSLRGKVSE